MISASSAAIWSVRARERSEIGSDFFLRGPHTTNFNGASRTATSTASATSATSTSGQVIARPNRHSSPKLTLASGDAAGAGAASGSGFLLRFAGQDGKFEPRGVPFHARVFDGGQRAGEFDAEIFLRPRFVVDGLDFVERVPEIGDGLDHLLGVAAGVEFGLFEQAEAAGEVMDHFLPAGLEFRLAPAQFLERGAFALQVLLRALQFGEFLLRLDDLAVHLVAGGRAERVAGGRGRAVGRFVRLEIRVHKLRCIVIRSHVATLVPGGEV